MKLKTSLTDASVHVLVPNHPRRAGRNGPGAVGYITEIWSDEFVKVELLLSVFRWTVLDGDGAAPIARVGTITMAHRGYRRPILVLLSYNSCTRVPFNCIINYKYNRLYTVMKTNRENRMRATGSALANRVTQSKLATQSLQQPIG